MENTFVANLSSAEVELSAAEIIDLAYINGLFCINYFSWLNHRFIINN